LNLVAVIGIAILTTFAVLLLKGNRPEIAAMVGIAGSLVVVFMLVGAISGVMDGIASIVNRTGVRNELFVALLKIIGIGYLTEFAASICVDAGNQSMSQKVLLAGKIVILLLALPIVNNLIEIIAGVIG
jgi:stage III sporulation protein AD